MPSRTHNYSRAALTLVRGDHHFVPVFDSRARRAAHLTLRAMFNIYLFACLDSTLAWMKVAAGPRPLLLINIALAPISLLLIYVASRIDFEPPYRIEPQGTWPLVFFIYALAIAVAVSCARIA